MRGMDKLERLRAAVRTAVASLPGERVSLARAAGRALTRHVEAVHGAPPFACSAMDGYALRTADAAGPVRLAISRTIYAGELPGAPLAPGTAARIFTGAPLPPGADAVVREEATHEGDGHVELRDAPRVGENVRHAGEDVAAGAVALPAGVRLGSRQLALLAAVGVEEVEVARRPRVALLSTGDEVVSGRTPDSNGVALAGALAALGAEVDRLRVPDDLDALAKALGAALASSDAVVTVGGVSIGARDHVRAAVERIGGEVRVHGVPMKPGKPFLFALAGGKPVFGMPGSPSACLVAFEVFARPALLALAGAARHERRRLRLPLAEPLGGRPGRARFVWARLEPAGTVRPMAAMPPRSAGRRWRTRSSSSARVWVSSRRVSRSTPGCWRTIAREAIAPPPPACACVLGRERIRKDHTVGETHPVPARAWAHRGGPQALGHVHPFDRPRKDSARLRRAGAVAVALTGPHGIAYFGPPRGGMDALLALLPPCDLVVAEGFKGEPLPRVEVHRAAVGGGFLCVRDRRVLAVVSDVEPPRPLPWFSPREVEALAEWVARFALREGERGAGGAAADERALASRTGHAHRTFRAGKPDWETGMARTTTKKSSAGRRSAAAGARSKRSSAARPKARRRTGAATVQEAGRKGGRRTLERRGPEFYSRIGRKGGKTSGGVRRAAAKGRARKATAVRRKPRR